MSEVIQQLVAGYHMGLSVKMSLSLKRILGCMIDNCNLQLKQLHYYIL